MSGTESLDAAAVADEILSSATRLRIVDVVETKLRRAGSSDLEVADQSDAIVRKVRRRIETRVKDWDLEGRDPLGRLGGPDQGLWIPTSINVEQIRVWHGAIAALSGHELEGFVTLVLRQSGHVARLIPRAGNESGIDLYGRLVPDQSQGLLTSIPARLVGQVTQEHIGEDRVRKFKTDYGDFVTGRGRAAPVVQEWYWELRIPLLPVLVGVGGFSGPAQHYAHSFGCLTIDGDDLARGAAPVLDDVTGGQPTTETLAVLARRIERGL